jgi:hypothetical protein
MKIFDAHQLIGKLPKELRQMVMKAKDVPMSLALEKFSLDTIKLDELMSKNDPEYDCEECTYKGEGNYSPMRYVMEKYGEPAAKILDKLML